MLSGQAVIWPHPLTLTSLSQVLGNTVPDTISDYSLYFNILAHQQEWCEGNSETLSGGSPWVIFEGSFPPPLHVWKKWIVVAF